MSEKWRWLSLKEQRHNNFIFWHEGPPRYARSSYLPLMCPECGKIDEREAVLLPTEEDVRIRARTDIVGTSDGMVCFNRKAKNAYERNALKGLRFLPLTGDENYFLAWSEVWLSVNLEKASFQYDGEPCPICRRPRLGAYVGPMAESFQTPDDPAIICAPSEWRESVFSRNLWLLVSETVKQVFQSERLSGVEFNPLR
jgi:hypothetical protein